MDRSKRAHASISRFGGRACSLVKKTAKALGIRFASIDMIKTKEGWKVLEVNAGVMMEHFASSGENQYITAKAIYRDAILKMFEG